MAAALQLWVKLNTSSNLQQPGQAQKLYFSMIAILSYYRNTDYRTWSSFLGNKAETRKKWYYTAAAAAAAAAVSPFLYLLLYTAHQPSPDLSLLTT